jgi:hypothetical protein
MSSILIPVHGDFLLHGSNKPGFPSLLLLLLLLLMKKGERKWKDAKHRWCDRDCMRNTFISLIFKNNVMYTIHVPLNFKK